jgi:hypothetical protein
MEKFLENTTFNWIHLKDEKTEPNDELVTDLIGLLSNKPIKQEKFSYAEELELIAKILESVSEAIKDDTITESQAELLLKYLTSGVVSKRVSNIFDNILSKKAKSGWFLATTRKFETEDW